MKVLMISIDKGLLGRGQLGDVVERHAAYGQQVDSLDIIIFSLPGFNQNKISDKVTAYPTNSSSKLKYFFDGLKIGKKLFGEKGNKYDLIVTQDPFLTGLVGLKLKKEFRAKLLVHFHGDFWDNPNWLKEHPLNFLFLKISKKVVPRADGIRVMSQGIKQKLIKAGISENRINVISVPVNLEKYNRGEIKNQSLTSQTVIHVSRYDKVKDFTNLGQAFALVSKKIPTVKFIQIGGGEKAASEINNPQVEVKPLIDHLSLVDYFHQADVVVLSSTSESFGKVLVEAGAAAKPVVSTATTGAKEIVQDGYNGFLVPIGDPEKLASKIIELLENPNQAKQMGENGRKLVQEKYSDNTNKIIKFWQEIVNSNL